MVAGVVLCCFSRTKLTLGLLDFSDRGAGTPRGYLILAVSAPLTSISQHHSKPIRFNPIQHRTYLTVLCSCASPSTSCSHSSCYNPATLFSVTHPLCSPLTLLPHKAVPNEEPHHKSQRRHLRDNDQPLFSCAVSRAGTGQTASRDL